MILSKLYLWVVGRPCMIPVDLLQRHGGLGDVSWRRGGLPPRVGGWFLGMRSVAAIALWRTVWLGDEVEPTEELLLHESCHVQQFQAVRAFPLRYVLESLRRGYSANRFEVEARNFVYARVRNVRQEPPREDV